MKLPTWLWPFRRKRQRADARRGAMAAEAAMAEAREVIASVRRQPVPAAVPVPAREDALFDLWGPPGQPWHMDGGDRV